MDASAPDNGVRKDQEVGMKEVMMWSLHMGSLKM
jgi:hypothetical protein